jgi:hypothetical protein
MPSPASPKPTWTAFPCWCSAAASGARQGAPFSSTTSTSSPSRVRSPRLRYVRRRRRAYPAISGRAPWRERYAGPGHGRGVDRPLSHRHEVDPSEWMQRRQIPRRRDCRPGPRAVELLTLQGKAAALCRAGARDAQAELSVSRERLEAPVSVTIRGGCLPESHPLFLWTGFGARRPVRAGDRAGAQRDARRRLPVQRSGHREPQLHASRSADSRRHQPGRAGTEFPAELASSDAKAFLAALGRQVGRSAGRWKPPCGTGYELGTTRCGRLAGADERRRVTPFLLLEALQRQFGATPSTRGQRNGTFSRWSVSGPSGPAVARAGRLFVHGVRGAGGDRREAREGRRSVVALAGTAPLLMTGLELLTAAS